MKYDWISFLELILSKKFGNSTFLDNSGYDATGHHWETSVIKHTRFGVLLNFLCKNVKLGYHNRVFFTSIYKLRSYMNHPIRVQTVEQYENASINVIKTRLVTIKTIQTPDVKKTKVQVLWKSWKQFLFWIRHR